MEHGLGGASLGEPMKGLGDMPDPAIDDFLVDDEARPLQPETRPEQAAEATIASPAPREAPVESPAATIANGEHAAASTVQLVVPAVTLTTAAIATEPVAAKRAGPTLDESGPTKRPKPIETNVPAMSAEALKTAPSWLTHPATPPVVVKPVPATVSTVKPCWLCGRNDGLILPCMGCLISVHAECIGGHQLCGSCRITQAAPAFDPVATNDPTTAAMVRGIAYIHSVMSKPDLFSLVGHVSVLHLLELAVHAPPAVKPMAEYYIPQFTQRWLRDKLVDVVTKKLSTKDLINAIVGLYSLKRANVSNGLVEAIAVQIAQHSVVDLLGWDPRRELPNVRYSNLCGGCGIRNDRRVVKCKCGRLCSFPSLYEGFRSTFVIVYHAEQVGIPIGCSIVDVIQHWPVLRKCYITNPASVQENTLYGEQLKMICSLLDLLSNHGTRLFHPSLFELEHKLLFNADMLRKWMNSTMYDQLGTALHCMQLFSATSPAHQQVIATCRTFVSQHQQPNGSWGFVNETHKYVDILRYKATHSCVKALMSPIASGFGPSHVDVHAYLQQWTPTPHMTPAGIPIPHRHFDNLRKIYKGHFEIGKPDDDGNTFRAAIQQHLSNLLQKTTETDPVVTPRGWQRYTRDVWDRDTVIESYNVLTMSDLSIFDGLKFEDGEVLVAADEAAANAQDDDLLINDDEDDDDDDVIDTDNVILVDDDDDDEETKTNLDDDDDENAA